MNNSHGNEQILVLENLVEKPASPKVDFILDSMMPEDDISLERVDTLIEENNILAEIIDRHALRPEVFLDTDNSVKQYLHSIGRVDLLTREEELALSRIMRRGRYAEEIIERADDSEQGENLPENIEILKKEIASGQLAKEHFIKSNLRLTVSIAKRYKNIGIDLLDLISEGNSGLMMAIDRFDPDRGLRFSTYGSYWIRMAIGRFVSEKQGTIKIPEQVRIQLRQYQSAISSLQQEGKNNPSDEDIKYLTGLTTSEIKRCKQASLMSNLLSLDKGSMDEESDSPKDSLYNVAITNTGMSDDEEETEKRLISSHIQQILNTALNGGTLTKRHIEVLGMRFGLGNCHAMTLQEAGDNSGVSRERIRQIEAQAIKRLRSSVHSQKLEELAKWL